MSDPSHPDRPAPDAGLRGSVTVPGSDDVAVRYTRRGDATEFEVIAADPDRADDDLVAAVAATVAAVSRRPDLAGSAHHLAADHPADRWHALPQRVATAVGFADRRDLLQLRRPLPVASDDPARPDGAVAVAVAVAVRPFAPGADDERWLRVNNAAFATHPDQGRETPETLAARQAEPWFDAAGFLVADDPGRPGELSGFCWTKVHPPAEPDPAAGEIYVIGIDPSHRGRGLGAAFVVAGLDHLAGLGLGLALLYVEADNDPALRLYDRLGFTVHRRRRVYAP